MDYSITGHTTKAFDADLQGLARMIAEMGGLAERQITESIEALTTRNRARARRVIVADEAIDSMQRAIEMLAVETLARRQPVAVDLRRIVATLRIANELERIGDLAKNIGKRTVAVDGEVMPREGARSLGEMANLILAQLRNVLDSFARRDAAAAIDVWTRDEEIDRLCTALFRDLLASMTGGLISVSFGIHLLFCIKNLERMGDHATNIAEAVHYMVNGEPMSGERPKADATSTMGAALLAHSDQGGAGDDQVGWQDHKITADPEVAAAVAPIPGRSAWIYGQASLASSSGAA